MSNAELDAMVRREQLFRGVLLPVAALLMLGWIIFNDTPRPPERFDTSSLAGCYRSQRGLELRLEADRLLVTRRPPTASAGRRSA